MPINQVAKELGVCATILKKICRRNGIPRWPHRKIKSLDKMIANLEVNLSKNPTEREEINHEVEVLRTKKHEIMQNPDILVSKTSRHGKQQNLASNMKKSKVRGECTVTTFRVKELTQPTSDEDSSDEFNWQDSPSPRRADRGPHDIQRILDDSYPAIMAASRRPSLPVILDSQPMQQGPSPAAINLPPPIRRHSMDSFLKSKSSFAISNGPAYHSAPSVVDMSQKLPEFNFPLSTQITHSSMLPCIEPNLNIGVIPNLQDKNGVFPDWFVAEKNRVLGRT